MVNFSLIYYCTVAVHLMPQVYLIFTVHVWIRIHEVPEYGPKYIYYMIMQIPPIV